MPRFVDVRLHEGCRGLDCPSFVTHWSAFWEHYLADDEPPTAVALCDGYYESLRSKSRAMVRQARRRFEFRPFLWDDEYAAVERINLSRIETSEGPMRGWYTRPCAPGQHGRNHGAPLDLCDRHDDVWLGAYGADDVMGAYVRIARMEDCANICYLLAHASAVGAINGLLAHIAENSGASYITYGWMDAGSPGRRVFKERVGFREEELVLRTV